jgi:hypothetical protein
MTTTDDLNRLALYVRDSMPFDTWQPIKSELHLNLVKRLIDEGTGKKYYLELSNDYKQVRKRLY